MSRPDEVTGQENPRAGVGAWVEHVRKRIDFKALDAEATKPISLIVAGPRRDEFLRDLQSAGPAAADAVLQRESLTDISLADTGGVGAAVYCPEQETTNGALSAVAALPFPVFVVRTGDASMPDVARLRTSPGSSKPARGAASIYYVSAFSLAEMRKYLLPDIAHAMRSDMVGLAAAIPAFRPVVAATLTLDCAMLCLKIGAASALADHIPILGIVTGGIASAGDTIAITALQMNLLLRIAAAYGKKRELARIIELIPVVGGGYAWRTLAREASGFIPVAGIPIKAAIAYAGTLVVGRAASYYYETGLTMSPKAAAALYREAADSAKEFARQLIARATRKTR